MPFTDAQLKELIDLGASDQEIMALERGDDLKIPQAKAQTPYESGMSALAGGAEKTMNTIIDASPVGSARYIKKGLEGTGPMTPLGAGLAAADIASLGLGSRVKGAASAGKYLAEQAASSLGAGAAMAGAEALGGDSPLVRIPAAILGAVAGGRAAGFKPDMVNKAVPKGGEAQALGRTIQGMGIPMEVPKSSKPGDVFTAFSDVRNKLGKNVESAKEALYQTEASTPLIRRRVSGAGYGALKDAGVPILESGMAPELSKNPEAAKAVMDALDKINSIPKGTPKAQAMQISNNVIEALQAKLAQSAKPGSPVNLKGPIMGGAIGSMEKSLKELGPEGTAAAMDAADSAFSKLASLHDMAFKSSKTMALEGPRFNPRKFLYMWESMKPAEKASKFTVEEIAALDNLVTQKDPNIFMNAARKAVEVGLGAVNKLGLVDLKHHPATRFYEKATPLISSKEASQGAKASARRETYGGK